MRLLDLLGFCKELVMLLLCVGLLCLQKHRIVIGYSGYGEIHLFIAIIFYNTIM